MGDLPAVDARVQTAIETMHRLLSDRLSICTLSKSVNLSPARLRQLFKEETGRSPLQYLRDLRLQVARELLRSTFLSIKEVAFRSGAQNLSHFMRQFKKQCGVTPSEFRGRCETTTKRSMRASKDGE
jgi:transcriptional regulator GlxA family with amidase domain